MSREKKRSNRVFFAYVPVLHQGYLDFFQKYPDITTLILPDQKLIRQYRPLVKDLRALSPAQIAGTVSALGIFPRETVHITSISELQPWNTPNTEIIAPDEDISHQLIEEFLPTAITKYDTTFLRWDKRRTTAATDVKPDTEISTSDLDTKLIQRARNQADHSPDWWRQVGAVLIGDGQVLLEAYNHHLPDKAQHHIYGDPRANFQSGEAIELSTAIHAEANIIAQAAKKGLVVDGTSLYCTTFPCPVCAKLIAVSGIKKVYFADGYALLDGEMVLKAAGVKLIRVT